MAREELEGEWVQGWPDRKRARLMPSKDADGRTIYARTPLLEPDDEAQPAIKEVKPPARKRRTGT